MKNILSLFKNNKNIQTVLNELNNNNIIKITSTTDNHNVLLSSLLYEENNEFVFYVASNVYKASKFYDSAVKVLGLDNVNLYVSNEVVATEVDAVNKEFLFERLQTVTNILENKKKLIVCDVNSCLKELMPRKIIDKFVLRLKLGDDIERKDLILHLIKLGYKKVPTTNTVGDFSVRGEIIDIYPINYDKPIRLDFFDTSLEAIKFFDKDKQISIKGEKINDLVIMPYTELIYEDIKDLEKALNSTNYNINQDLEYLKNYTYSERLKKYVHYLYDKTESILDYTDNKVIIF